MRQNNGKSLEGFQVIFSPVKRIEAIETDMMKEIMGRTLAAHGCSPLIVWYGHTRIGKTTTARLLTQKINDAFDPDDPNAFRALHYEVGKIEAGNATKKGLKSLYKVVIGNLDEGVYHRESSEALANRIVEGMIKKNIQLVFIDEIQMWPLDAIRSMALVCDKAGELEKPWPLTFVFIGMDDLPLKMQQTPRVEARIQDWCYFTEYDLENTWKLLAKLHTHFEALNKSNEEHQRQVEYVHETCGGFPGHLVPFIQKLEYRSLKYGGVIDMTFLRGVKITMLDDKQKSFDHYREISRVAAVEAHEDKVDENPNGKAGLKPKPNSKGTSKRDAKRGATKTGRGKNR